MKHKMRKGVICLLISVSTVFCMMTASLAKEESFLYEHDPRLNPYAMADIITDPDTVYGFRPDPDSKRLGAYADYDWTDPVFVAESRQVRADYHEGFRDLYELRDRLAAEGKNIEEIARSVSALRNEIRLRIYEEGSEGLAAVKKSNLEAYGNEYGPTADSLYEKYGSWETVLEKAFSTNSGMDACLGFYDELYDTYVSVGQISDEYYSDAMQWCYSERISDTVTNGVYDPAAKCTRAEAVTILWAAAGSPEASSDTLPFGDVSYDCYYFGALCWAYENGIVNGTAEGVFSPDKAASRAQMVTMLSRYAGGKPEGRSAFTDVSENAYYFDTVCWAFENGIANGTAAGIFNPDAQCSRANAVTFLWRACGK